MRARVSTKQAEDNPRRRVLWPTLGRPFRRGFNRQPFWPPTARHLPLSRHPLHRNRRALQNFVENLGRVLAMEAARRRDDEPVRQH